MKSKLNQWIEDVLSDNADARFHATRALKTMGAKAKASVPALYKSLFRTKDYWDKTNPEHWDHHELSYESFEALCRIDPAATFQLLSRNPEEFSLKWLARLPGFGKELKPILFKALEHKKDSVRGAAAALSAVIAPDPDVVAAFESHLSEKDPWVKIQMLEGLGTLGPAAAVAIPAISLLLKSREVYETRPANDETETYYVRDAAKAALKKIAPQHAALE